MLGQNDHYVGTNLFFLDKISTMTFRDPGMNLVWTMLLYSRAEINNILVIGERLTSNVWAGYSPRLLRARYAPATRPLRARYAPATRPLRARYAPATRPLRARYAPATRRRFFAREPYYRSLMARLLKHK